MTTTEKIVRSFAEITTPVADLKWEDMHPGSPQKFSVWWGDPKKGPFGMLLKQPGGGFEAGMHAHASDYYAVLVQGTWIHTVEGNSSAPKELKPGSYVFSRPGSSTTKSSWGPKTALSTPTSSASPTSFRSRVPTPAEKQ
ncbi:MAG TPA: DUF4437 domain-containing protein [Candidatus Angelobacter sp.]